MRILCGTILAAAMAVQGAECVADSEDYSRWVNPFVGTSATGHTFPAACVPFGLVQAGPDTVGADGLWWHYCSGYRYEDSRIVGFSQTHLNGTGGIDLGDISILPLENCENVKMCNCGSMELLKYENGEVNDTNRNCHNCSQITNTNPLPSQSRHNGTLHPAKFTRLWDGSVRR